MQLREGIDFSCDDDCKEAVLELLEQSGSDIALKVIKLCSYIVDISLGGTLMLRLIKYQLYYN